MRDKIKSWAAGKFNSNMKIYRADKTEAEILKGNLGKIVDVKVHDPEFPRAGPTTFSIKVLKFLGYDDTHESMIPQSDKNFSKGQGKFVPNRFIFKINRLFGLTDIPRRYRIKFTR